MPKIVLPSKDVGELIILSFDFSSFLQPGDVITSTVVTSTLYSGTDTNPGILVSPYTPTITNNVVTCGCSGGVSGDIYSITCNAYIGSAGLHNLTGYLAVVPTLS